MTQFDHLREKLVDYQVPIDTDALWARTSHAIPGRRRRRLIFWLVGVGLVTLAGFAALETLVAPATPSVVSSRSSAGEAEPAASSVAPNGELPLRYSAQEDHASSQAMRSDNDPSGSHRAPDRHLKTTNPAVKGSGSDPTGSLHHVIPETDNRQPFNLSEGSISAVDADPPASKDLPTPSTVDNQVIAPTPTETAANTILDKPWRAPVGEAVGNGRTEWSMADDRSEFHIVNALPPLTPSWAAHPSAAAPPVPPTPDWTIPRTPASFSLLLITGIGGSAMDVRAEDPEDEAEAARWEESLRSLEYVSAALQGNVHFAKRWQVGLSLDYGRLVTEQTYVWETTGRVTGTGTSVIIINEDGSQNLVTGEVTSTRTSTIQSTRFNTHQTLGLEAILGYSVWRSHGFDLIGWVSGGINYWYRASGSMPNSSWEPIPIPSTQSPFKLATPFTWAIGADAQWRFSRHGYARIRASLDQLGYLYEQDDTRINFQHRMGSFSLGAGYIW